MAHAGVGQKNFANLSSTKLYVECHRKLTKFYQRTKKILLPSSYMEAYELKVQTNEQVSISKELNQQTRTLFLFPLETDQKKGMTCILYVCFTLSAIKRKVCHVFAQSKNFHVSIL